MYEKNVTSSSTVARARPLFPRVGTKAQLVDRILAAGPSTPPRRVFVPFLGTGADTLAFAERWPEAQIVVNDADTALISIVDAIVADVDGFLVEAHAECECVRSFGATYYRTLRTLTKAPARFITRLAAFNGLNRVNAAGGFNVPPRTAKELAKLTIDVENVRAFAREAARWECFDMHFDDFLDMVEPGDGDFVYCDPPYHGVFTGYIAQGFTQNEQTALIEHCAEIDGRGAHVVYSNADDPAVHTWLSERWPNAKVEIVSTMRSVAAKAKSRKVTAEIMASSRRAP